MLSFIRITLVRMSLHSNRTSTKIYQMLIMVMVSSLNDLQNSKNYVRCVAIVCCWQTLEAVIDDLKKLCGRYTVELYDYPDIFNVSQFICRHFFSQANASWNVLSKLLTQEMHNMKIKWLCKMLMVETVLEYRHKDYI